MISDIVLYKESWINKNYISIFKKIYFKKKILDIKKIFKYDMSFSIWNSKTLDKNLTFKENTASEIYDMTKNMLLNKNKNNNLKFLKKFNINNAIYKNLALRKCNNKFFNENLK